LEETKINYLGEKNATDRRENSCIRPELYHNGTDKTCSIFENLRNLADSQIYRDQPQDDCGCKQKSLIYAPLPYGRGGQTFPTLFKNYLF
jgi:hypothetical protein